MKLSKIENKANKTKLLTDISNYKKLQKLCSESHKSLSTLADTNVRMVNPFG